ncbi:RagB/SusD family nutrient uptake outer membrane protein [Litoribacter ruber]|uniref:RagB/SusD family nutrient uptake outer membrane protein n=1 Tax=Litoribacter ruber TaxID=702568 RepID=UPI001BDA7F4A|nr:RagB/SusD family nutrient uptake outer membrane protein [Litoribacter ruber]MBT0811940.1 RagB/SusD family nutrient uptake outer membrane protein [Litoribacter ruber]
MKKYIYTILIAGICSSCADFLQEEPRDEMSSEQFFTIPQHAHDAVNSLYRNGAPQIINSAASYGGSRAMLGNYMSGYFDNEYRGQEPHVQHTQQLTLNGVNLATYLGNTWADLYRGIARANNAIKYIPTIEALPANEASMLLAEARFFRAFSYFYLAKMFGPVPLIVDPYESLENLYMERAPLEQIYGLIVSDLEFAINEGGLSQSSMANNGNRIAQGTAQALLADVYLTMSGYPLQQDNYQNAAAMARSVVSSGSYALVDHDRDGDGNVIPENSAYNKIRRASVSPSEYIYFVEYTVGIANNTYPVYTMPVSVTSEAAYGVTNGAYQPLSRFLNGYDPQQDLRVQEKQYFHSSFTNNQGNTFTFGTAPYMWHDETAIRETAASGKDVAVYRYADVLLTGAEAIAQSEGVTDEAVRYLADVRSRAYFTQTREEIEADLRALSAGEFIQEVWKERFREQVFEFHLWADIQRTRQYPITQEGGVINYVDVIGQPNGWGRSFTENNLLFPIPETELQRNPALTQNPGY